MQFGERNNQLQKCQKYSTTHVRVFAETMHLTGVIWVSWLKVYFWMHLLFKNKHSPDLSIFNYLGKKILRCHYWSTMSCFDHFFHQTYVHCPPSQIYMYRHTDIHVCPLSIVPHSAVAQSQKWIEKLLFICSRIQVNVLFFVHRIYCPTIFIKFVTTSILFLLGKSSSIIIFSLINVQELPHIIRLLIGLVPYSIIFKLTQNINKKKKKYQNIRRQRKQGLPLLPQLPYMSF